MQVGDSHIFLAGDITGERALLHEAGTKAASPDTMPSAHRYLLSNAKVPLSINFCDPNILSCRRARWSDDLTGRLNCRWHGQFRARGTRSHHGQEPGN